MVIFVPAKPCNLSTPRCHTQARNEMATRNTVCQGALDAVRSTVLLQPTLCDSLFWMQMLIGALERLGSACEILFQRAHGLCNVIVRGRQEDAGWYVYFPQILRLYPGSVEVHAEGHVLMFL